MPSEEEKQKLDDLLRRIDHHGFTLRNATIDFFKTAFIVQMGGLVTILSIIFSHYPEPTAFPVAYKGIVQRLSFNLLGGTGFAALGYIASITRASLITGSLRRNIDRYLHHSGRIDLIEHEKNISFLIFFIGIIVFASFSYDIIAMLDTIDKIMPDFHAK